MESFLTNEAKADIQELLDIGGGGGEEFVVSLRDYPISSSKTYDEINTAFKAGKTIIGISTHGKCYCSGKANTQIGTAFEFNFLYVVPVPAGTSVSSVRVETFLVVNDGGVKYFSQNLKKD